MVDIVVHNSNGRGSKIYCLIIIVILEVGLEYLGVGTSRATKFETFETSQTILSVKYNSSYAMEYKPTSVLLNFCPKAKNYTFQPLYLFRQNKVTPISHSHKIASPQFPRKQNKYDAYFNRKKKSKYKQMKSMRQIK